MSKLTPDLMKNLEGSRYFNLIAFMCKSIVTTSNDKIISGRNINPTDQGNPRISINYHGNVTAYFIHIDMTLTIRGWALEANTL